MRDIPEFTCPYGAAKLVLRHIPVFGTAYCLVAAAWDLPGLLAQCREACRMAGAGRIYAGGTELPGEPAFRVWRMTAPRQALPPAEATLEPLTAGDGEAYLAWYNRAMAAVPGASALGRADLPALLSGGGCYFVRRDGQRIGLGQVAGNRLLAVAALPSRGREVAAALLSAAQGDPLTLEVADTNHPAMGLYRALGFAPAAVVETWWDIT